MILENKENIVASGSYKGIKYYVLQYQMPIMDNNGEIRQSDYHCGYLQRCKLVEEHFEAVEDLVPGGWTWLVEGSEFIGFDHAHTFDDAKYSTTAKTINEIYEIIDEITKRGKNNDNQSN